MNGTGQPADEHPFTVLGLWPGAGPAQVKRAYFARLAQHPPHADPAGFRRLRSAYEAVSSPAGFERAAASAPPDVAAGLALWESRFGAALAAAVSARETGPVAAAAGQRFIESVSRLTLAEACAAFGDQPPAPGPRSGG